MSVRQLTEPHHFHLQHRAHSKDKSFDYFKKTRVNSCSRVYQESLGNVRVIRPANHTS